MSAGPLHADVEVHGLPFSSSYPFEEIGNVTRGARLDFDAHGRLVVVQEGVYAVLNDTAWVDLSENTRDNSTAMSNVVRGADGLAYYGGLGSWGIARTAPDGRLRAESLVSSTAPEWTRAASFDRIVTTQKGVYFSGWSGVIYWSFAKRQTRFFEIPGVADIFRVGEKMFVSAHGRRLLGIDGESGASAEVAIADFEGATVDQSTELDEDHTLVCVAGGRLLVCDGQETRPWPAQARNGLIGRVSAVKHLVDGGVAVAITGKGLFVISAKGDLVSALTAPQYHRITRLAARERGVLWAMEENAIEKILYGGPLTAFGQGVGLPISWPLIVRWRDRIVVSCEGKLYEAVSGNPGSPSRFEPFPIQPLGGAWGLESNGTDMLVANSMGIMRAQVGGGFTPILRGIDVMRLVMVGTDLCFAINLKEIAVLRLIDGVWREAAPRIPGAGSPLVVHAAKRSVWVEYGGGKAGRLAFENGAIQLRLFEDPAWNGATWVNIGIVDDIIVLNGSARNRRFFNDRTEQFCEAPELQRLLDRSPYWITRIRKDDTGVLWATHRDGIVRYTPKGGDYEIDCSSFDLVTDLYPVVHILPGNDIWLTGGRSLCHVEDPYGEVSARASRPVLVSVTDARTNLELINQLLEERTPPSFRFEQNSLRFRYFSGGYGWRRAPAYEFRLNGADSWETLAAGSSLSFSGLREGSYRLEVRIARSTGGAEFPEVFRFDIRPPWFRSPLAYAGYLLGSMLAIVGIVRWAGYRSRQRNLVLERLVRERTSELEATMAKLNEETRVTATLDERNRLAGEIHDSMQQGLSGAILQLDATLLLPTVAGQIRSRLEVVRNMMSFTRHEVQHAVWDMESTLLQDTELSDALRKLTALVNPGTVAIEVLVSGSQLPLPASAKHHLLRIAQEATTNAIRHSQARRITIQLDYSLAGVRLAVGDDGIGFNPDDVLVKSAGHFGLRGIRSRVRRVNGELQVESSPGHGTSITVHVPLNHESVTSNARKAAVV